MGLTGTSIYTNGNSTGKDILEKIVVQGKTFLVPVTELKKLIDHPDVFTAAKRKKDVYRKNFTVENKCGCSMHNGTCHYTNFGSIAYSFIALDGTVSQKNPCVMDDISIELLLEKGMLEKYRQAENKTIKVVKTIFDKIKSYFK